MKTNMYGVKEDELVLTVYDGHLNAFPFINWIRDLKKRSVLFEARIDEPTTGDIFAMQILKKCLVNILTDQGTAVTMPDDVRQILMEMYGYEKDESEDHDS